MSTTRWHPRNWARTLHDLDSPIEPETLCFFQCVFEKPPTTPFCEQRTRARLDGPAREHFLEKHLQNFHLLQNREMEREGRHWLQYTTVGMCYGDWPRPYNVELAIVALPSWKSAAGAFMSLVTKRTRPRDILVETALDLPSFFVQRGQARCLFFLWNNL